MSFSLSPLSIAYHIKHIIILAILFVMIDGIYLSWIQGFFQRQIRAVQGSALVVDYGAAILAYIFLVMGLYYFIIREKRSPFQAALLGWVIYGVYEYTNKSLLKKWEWQTTIIDTIWGGVLFYLSTLLLYKLQPILRI